MKNSQYVNSCNVNLSEMARLTFQEQMPQHNNEVAHVITLSMHIEFLKYLHDIIGNTLVDHAKTIAKVSKDTN